MSKDIIKSIHRGLRPAPKLTHSEWADEYYYLPPGSANEGKWKTLPYQKEILDCISDKRIRFISVQKSARVGATECCICIPTGKAIHQDPANILITQPTLSDAEGFSKESLDKMFECVPVLRSFAQKKKRNTILKKMFAGGQIWLTGANSAMGFRRISAKYVLLDEVDGYPPAAGNEGDQVSLAIRRSETYWDSKVIMCSTPLLEGKSKINIAFKQSDQRYYHVPCPYCGGFQVLKWGGAGETFGFKWENREPKTVAYQCEHCNEHILPHQKYPMIEAGYWKASAPFKDHAGFHIWAAYSYSPKAQWQNIVEEFLKSYKQASMLQVFTNTWLGEVWKEAGEKADWRALKNRCENYKPLTVPDGTKILTCGVDVQENRLIIVIMAWGINQESWVLFHIELMGDPMQPEVWAQLDEYLNTEYYDSEKNTYRIVSCAVDSGGRTTTQAVYNYCRGRSPQVIAVKGVGSSGKPVLSSPSKQDISWAGKQIKNGIKLWSVGVDIAKSTIFQWLRNDTPGGGYIHFYNGLTEEFFLQLTAEQLLTKTDINGFPVSKWQKIRRRNDVLDCVVYSFAAAVRAGLYTLGRTAQPAQQKHKPKQEKRRLW